MVTLHCNEASEVDVQFDNLRKRTVLLVNLYTALAVRCDERLANANRNRCGRTFGTSKWLSIQGVCFDHHLHLAPTMARHNWWGRFDRFASHRLDHRCVCCAIDGFIVQRPNHLHQREFRTQMRRSVCVFFRFVRKFCNGWQFFSTKFYLPTPSPHAHTPIA